jgi:multidrug transporter EmrE-like cation transporter
MKSWMDGANFNMLMLCLTEVFGDFKFKDYARKGGSLNLSQGIAWYAGVIFFLIRSLRLNDVIWVNGMWDGASAAIESLFAYYMFGERLEKSSQYFGLVLIIIGLFLLKNGVPGY